MAEQHCLPAWRFFRSWAPAELEARLSAVRACPVSAPDSEHASMGNPTWRHYYSEALIFGVGPGSLELTAAFDRACGLVANFEFSDPRIVVGHFDPKVPLLGRTMLLELKALRCLSYLCGVLVRAVRDELDGQRRVFGFRYDTLVGHIEAGSEWFLLTRDDVTQQITFRIQAAWKPGQFPNWWSRVGFSAVGTRYQRAWHRLAHVRMREFLGAINLPPLPRHGRLLHEGRPAVMVKTSAFTGPEQPSEIHRETQS